MNPIKERLAYLKGLAEGLNVGQGSPEGRVLVGMLDVMNEMARTLDRLTMMQEQLEEYIEAVDDDLTDLEEELYGELDEDEFEYDADLELDEADTGIEYLEMSCPNCKETVFVDEDVFRGDEIVEVLCPECQETILVNDNSYEDGVEADDLLE
ncbi:CD1247 N-terminal domain-containing protein [Tumebacillus lipolyticus]|uniref:CD1247 N-terminal domain-containing protein n=1 Tax=Tumebacillus lipolyticus TaxID=1280370 RepID=A0ABW4ZSK5_9BACL